MLVTKTVVLTMTLPSETQGGSEWQFKEASVSL